MKNDIKDFLKSVILSSIDNKEKQEMLTSLAKGRPSELSEEAINEISNSNFSGLINIVLSESLKTDDEIEQEMLREMYPSCDPNSPKYSKRNEKQFGDIHVRESSTMFPFFEKTMTDLYENTMDEGKDGQEKS